MKRGTKKLILSCLVLLMVAVLLAPLSVTTGCAKPAAVSEWNIPVISALTGPIAFVGVPALWGAEFAAKEINEAGGINEVPIEITPYDTAFENAKAVSAMARAVDGSLVIVGPMDGPGAEAAGTTAAEAGVPFIAGLARADLRDRFKPWGISVMQDDSAGEGPAVTEWIKLNPDIKSVVVFYHPMEPCQVEQFQAVKAALNKLGVKVLGPIEVTPGQVDMGPAAVKAMDLKPDGYYSIVGMEYPPLVVELYNRGVTDGRRLCCSFAGVSPALFEVAKGKLENSYIYNKIDVGYEGAKWQTMVEAYEAEHEGQPLTVETAPNHYDAVYAVKAAFEAQGITGDPAKLVEERKKISDFLYNSPELEGAQGKFKFVNGRKVAPVYFFQVRDNKLVKISTIGGG